MTLVAKLDSIRAGVFENSRKVPKKVIPAKIQRRDLLNFNPTFDNSNISRQ